MPKFRLSGRAGLAGAIALVCASAIACDSVLDIDDPMMRLPDGEGGEPGSSGGAAGKAANAGSATTPEAGTAGEGGGSGGGTSGSGGTMTVTAGAGSGGEGGEPVITPRDCETDSVRCTEARPEVCDELGRWVQNEEEATGECAVLCDAGRCVECLPEQKRCAVCEEGDAGCTTNQPQGCVDGAWQSEGAVCAGYCDVGRCVLPPSCPLLAGAQAQCGDESCCKSFRLPGGTYKRGYDGVDYTDDSYPATVSPFYLDRFEVTVGRFRRFVNTFDDLSLAEGEGKSPHVVGDVGWTSKLDLLLPADRAALIAELNCGASATWSDNDLENNQLPINCVSFAVAYAFCIRDGGRLPTEAEWNFASAGGDQQRVYPWAPPAGEEPITPEYAGWGNATPGPVDVGSTVLGDGRWGQADLASNVREWVLDYFRDDEYPMPCVDCMNAATESSRGVRGGAWSTPQEALVSSERSGLAPQSVRVFMGFRCARDSEAQVINEGE